MDKRSPLFYCPAPAARPSSRFSPAVEVKRTTSTSGLPALVGSVQAASAFLCPAPAARPSSRFSPAEEAKRTTSTSGLPALVGSVQAASAFLCPAPSAIGSRSQANPSRRLKYNLHAGSSCACRRWTSALRFSIYHL
ncbi:hypothetical protein ABE096_02365 [Robertmurraya massiliosenegalensis]|uniref:hypothetical protein n=1 Tax=Robertmurraya TaxID=2837507 RepID=UPI0039A5A85B